jgi:mono/diheme cytochrome c family protein
MLIIGVTAMVTGIALLPVRVAAADAPANTKVLLERGRYMVKMAGCNDCHTAGYVQIAGKVPEKDWLMGDAMGWRGPWGTTYAINLRLYMQPLSEAEWLKKSAALTARPPMPWFSVREMNEADRRAIYHFIKSLGPVGKPAPAYLPPNEQPKGPYAQFPMPPKQ